jgi:hypothetical protein
MMIFLAVEIVPRGTSDHTQIRDKISMKRMLDNSDPDRFHFTIAAPKNPFYRNSG